jgi:hypothetical protein
MCGAAASCSIAINVCWILEIDLEKPLRGGNSILALTLVYFPTPRLAGGAGILWLSTLHTSVDDQSLEQNIQVAQLALPGLGPVEFWMKDRG